MLYHLCPLRRAGRQGSLPIAEYVLIVRMGRYHGELRKPKAGAPNLYHCGPPASDALGDLDLADTKRIPLLNADFQHSISPVHAQTEK